ncbi:MAG: NERD domain-containing protein [Candidatus Shapirobacteria bacterium]|nr:NERD domain-containing protein [Candidatus Shapirobacteria bacterium]
MIRLIPPLLSSENKSSGERKLFNLFLKSGNTDDWTVLHSLNLSEHINQICGEIDFLVLAPNLGIFCLEVKSGNVTCHDGLWIYRDRFGVDHKSTKGPFVQVKDNMFSLIEWVKKKTSNNPKLINMLFGYGVVFPDVSFNIDSIEYDRSSVFDNMTGSIESFITTLAENTKKKEENLGRKRYLPSLKDIETLVSILRPEFEVFRSTKDILNDTEEKISSFTEEQYKCLDSLKDNPRCLFNGAAGTGKTVIAVESVKRKVFDEKRVLFICFNSLLSEWLKSRFTDSEKKFVTIETLPGYMEKIAAIPEYIKRDNYYFDHVLPTKAAELIVKDFSKFDYLIVDEGQDIISEVNFAFLDKVLKNGIAKGFWEIYCDMDRQSLFAKLSPKLMREKISKWSPNGFVSYKLNINCRNTKNIAEEISLVCGFEKDQLLPGNIEGNLPVNYKFVDHDQIPFEIDKIVDFVYSKKIPLNRITVLSPKKYQLSEASKIKSKCTVLERNNLFSIPVDSITFSTIGKFKGLENSFIVVTDFDSIEEDCLEKLYVAMSRAKYGLYLIMGKEAEKDYDSIVSKVNSVQR